MSIGDAQVVCWNCKDQDDKNPDLSESKFTRGYDVKSFCVVVLLAGLRCALVEFFKDDDVEPLPISILSESAEEVQPVVPIVVQYAAT